MKKTIAFISLLFMLSVNVSAQNDYAHKWSRPLSEVLEEVRMRFNLNLRIEVDTAGLMLRNADSRIRPYSAYESLKNIVAPFDYNVLKERDVYRIRKYEPYYRSTDEGKALLAHLTSLYPTKEDWELRRKSLREEIKVISGLDSALSERVSAQPVIMGLREYNGYKVENFYLETLPGLYVTGSIYSPVVKSVKYPLLICPNGHAREGRYEASLQIVPAAIAKMGAVCVTYDLYGYGDSEKQVGKNAHKTPQAMSFQLLSGISILDIMTARGDIDSERIGAVGQSGGGTQVMLLSLLDDRIKASCPVTMVSSFFDGGCACESGRPIMQAGGGTCLAEIAACAAPKPMLVISVGGDWTHKVPEIELPYIRNIYEFYGEKDWPLNVHLEDEYHDFGPNKRKHVYKFFADIWHLDHNSADEDGIEIESAGQLSAFGIDGKYMPENAKRYDN